MRPNIILILTDDMGYGDLTCYGPGAGVSTTHIDQLAKEGLCFTQYYTPAPVCSPSRAGILSGHFPGRHQLNTYLQTRAGNRACDQNDYLDPKAANLPRTLKAAGYATAHFGKWHLGGGRDVDNAPSITEYGFDEWASTWESPDPHPELGIQFAPWDKQTEPGQVVRHRRTEWMVDKTLDFARRHKDTPFYINLWPDDMHDPYRPGPEMAAKYGVAEDPAKTPRKSFQAVLDEYDRQIGRLLDGLRKLGLDKNTIVIFTSDNGAAPHFKHERTGGLRGMKISLYEGGIRVPFIVRWPGQVPAGAVDGTTVISAIDLPLTLCRLAGVEPPKEIVDSFDGQDMSAALSGTPTARTKAIFWEYGRNPTSFGYPQGADRSPNVAVRAGQWKLLINDDATSRELYNMVADPNETTDVAEAHPAIADDLTSRALAWRRALPGRSHPK